MKHFWPKEDLIEFFTISAQEQNLSTQPMACLKPKSIPTKTGFAMGTIQMAGD